MTALAIAAPGRVSLPGSGVYPNSMDIITDMEKAPPGGKDALPDDAVISIKAWSQMQGVAVATVHRNRVKAAERREAGTPKRGDMPPEDGKLGSSPYWLMSTYRAWEASRPGRGAGAGRPKGSGKGRSPRVRLPISCPNCGHVITSKAEAGQDGPEEAGRAA